MDDEDMESKLKKLAEQLQEALGNSGKVLGPFSFKNAGDILKVADDYMNKPIVILSANRKGTKLEVKRM